MNKCSYLYYFLSFVTTETKPSMGDVTYQVTSLIKNVRRGLRMRTWDVWLSVLSALLQTCATPP